MADIARIKGNISKMIAQNAPEADIDAYVASEGVSLDQLKAPATKPDKYQQAALDEQADLKAKGIDPSAGITRRLAHGATLGADNTIVAAAMTPLEMIRRRVGPVEGYNFAKAREDQIMDDARKNTGVAGTVAEIAGGGVSGAGLARSGMTLARFLAPEAGLLARAGASAADAAAVGAFSGAMEGNGLAERGENALKGGAIGAAAGGILPPVIALGGTALSPIISNIRARINPEGFARSQIARGVSESGMTPAQIANEVQSAASQGQGMFTAADAMGNAGQRLLASTARAPGQARTEVVNFLDQRQAGQGRRVSNILDEGFGSQQTAAQTEARMTQARNAAADAEYGAIRNDAQPVDVSGAIARIDQTLAPYGVPQGPAAHDTAAAALASIRARLTGRGGDLNDFNAVQRLRGDISDSAQELTQRGRGNQARLLRGILGELDTAMENASSGYRQANRNFAQASRDIEAVQAGRQAATRGRTEDIIPQFYSQTPQGREAFRAGYVDPLIQQAQGAAFGANKARPLINDAFQAESAAMNPGGNALMQRQIGRENTMFQTRNAATGNSKTAENLADDAALGLDPTVVGTLVSQLGTGNITGAVRTMLGAGQNMMTGNTPAVRQAVANMLMTRGGNANAAQFQRALDETMQRIQQIQQIARSLGRGAAGGLGVAGPARSR